MKSIRLILTMMIFKIYYYINDRIIISPSGRLDADQRSNY
jgi:hypothetical protein